LKNLKSLKIYLISSPCNKRRVFERDARIRIHSCDSCDLVGVFSCKTSIISIHIIDISSSIEQMRSDFWVHCEVPRNEIWFVRDAETIHEGLGICVEDANVAIVFSEVQEIFAAISIGYEAKILDHISNICIVREQVINRQWLWRKRARLGFHKSSKNWS